MHSCHSAACRVCRCEEVACVIVVGGGWVVRDDDCLDLAGGCCGCKIRACSAGPFEVQVTSYVIDIKSCTALPRSMVVAEIERFNLFQASTIIIKRQL